MSDCGGFGPFVRSQPVWFIKCRRPHLRLRQEKRVVLTGTILSMEKSDSMISLFLMELAFSVATVQRYFWQTSLR